MSKRRTLYAYLNIDNPLVAWEVAVGRIASNGMVTPVDFGISVWYASLLRKISNSGAVNSVVNEFALESYRQVAYPNAVSRLQGVFFFESEKMAHAAIGRWPSFKHKEYISAIDFNYEKLSFHDSEWVTDFMPSDDRDWFEPYLKGKTRWTKPFTEILATGIGSVVNKNLRSMAVERVLDHTPASSPILIMSIAAYNCLGIRDAGLSTPFMYLKEGKISVHQMTKMDTLEFNQKDIAVVLEQLYKSGEMNIPFIIPDDGVFIARMPDMRDTEFFLNVPNAVEVFESIHHSNWK